MMMPGHIERSAVLSEERPPLYRYQLDRSWDPDMAQMVWIMLNPSTADARVDDPTILACTDIARRNHCGSIKVVNLFAWRSSHPSDLWRAKDPVGPLNDRFIARAIGAKYRQRILVVAAWGTSGWKFGRDQHVCALAAALDVSLHCIGRTQQGHPKHPLARGLHRVARETPLETFEFR